MSKKKYKKLKKKYKNLKKSYKRLKRSYFIKSKIIENLNDSSIYSPSMMNKNINHKDSTNNNDIDKIDLGPGRKYSGIG